MKREDTKRTLGCEEVILARVIMPSISVRSEAVAVRERARFDNN